MYKFLRLAAAVPIYVRHFLNGRASGGSWRRSLASAMHARIRAVQQQSLPHAVLLPSNLPPLFPHLAPPCRLDSTPSLAPLPGGPQRQAHNGAVVANQDWQASSLAYGSNATPQRAHPVGAVRERSGFWKTTLSNSNAEDSLALQGVSQRSAGSGQLASQGSYAAALQSGASVMPGQKQHQDSNGLHKANKRKVTDLGELETQPQGPVKRPLNGTHAKVLDLEQQTADLQKLIADSNLSE